MGGPTVGEKEARISFNSLIEDASRGKATVITRRGVPVAVLAPIEQAQAPKRRRFLSLKGTGAGLWGERAGATVATTRNEWDRR
ncbi:MAG: type II toxin-antitoxin system Phd/YefM family antitoxin [Myxococcales bacterium]|jgi:prevent-host-death family protein